MLIETKSKTNIGNITISYKIVASLTNRHLLIVIIIVTIVGTTAWLDGIAVLEVIFKVAR